MVSSLRDSSGEWNLSLINNLFDQQTMENIKGLFWSKLFQDDKLVWLGSKTGRFTVKYAYNLEEGGNLPDEKWWKIFWRSKTLERSKFFLWHLAHHGLPTFSNLET